MNNPMEDLAKKLLGVPEQRKWSNGDTRSEYTFLSEGDKCSDCGEVVSGNRCNCGEAQPCE